MDKTELRPLFDWGVCHQCMMVSEGWDPHSASLSPCPSCGLSGLGDEWPPSSTRLLLRRAFGSQEDSGEESTFQAFLVAEAVDMMFAWVLRRAIEYRFSEDPDSVRYLEDFEGFGLSTEQSLDLLREVGGVRLHEVASLLEEPDFPERWDDLRTRHSRFACSDSSQAQYAFAGLTEKDLFEVCRMAVKVFAQVNNAVW